MRAGLPAHAFNSFPQPSAGDTDIAFWNEFSFFLSHPKYDRLDLSCPQGESCGGDETNRLYTSKEGTTISPSVTAFSQSTGLRYMFDRSNVEGSKNCGGENRHKH